MNGLVTVDVRPTHRKTGTMIAMISSLSTNSKDRLLRHKTTQRPIYDTGLADAKSKGYDEAIFFNTQGHLTEGAAHNIFIVKNGKWSTPLLADGVLPGLLRSSLLERYPAITEQTLRIDEVSDADEIYLGNSVSGLREVLRIDSFQGSKRNILWENKTERSTPHTSDQGVKGPNGFASRWGVDVEPQ